MKKNIFRKDDFERKNVFKKHDFEEKNIFINHDFEEKIIFEKQILKTICTQKSRFGSFEPIKCTNFASYMQF